MAVAAPAAGAATTHIGAVSEIAAGLAPEPATDPGDSPLYLVQVGESTGSYAVPAGYGAITAWRHSTGTEGGSVTFKVYRPTDNPGEFLVLAADTRTVTPGIVHTFTVRIPVRPGDRIGVSSDTVQVGYLCPGQLDGGTCNDPAGSSDMAGAFSFARPDPPVGTRATLDGAPFSGFRADVAAQVETDADRDGFGDDTQDECPASAAATRAPCPRPAVSPTPVATPFAGCPASASLVIRGTSAANTLAGTVRGDRIFAGTGNDRVDGLAGDDCIDLGPGADRGQGGPGADLVLGGSGNDRIHGTGGNDSLSGSSGRDRMNGGSGNDSIAGNSGGDRLTGGSGGDRISGGSGNDRIAARDGRRDRISCGRGRDRVVADRIDRVARDCERVR